MGKRSKDKKITIRRANPFHWKQLIVAHYERKIDPEKAMKMNQFFEDFQK